MSGVQRGLATSCLAVVVVLMLTSARADAQCGNGVVNGGEQCDLGAGVNGTVPVCCSATCTFKLVGTVCRGPLNNCQNNALCTGLSATCPANPNKPNGTPCSDLQFCNGAETCQSGTCTDQADPCSAADCSEGFNSCFPNGCPVGPAAGCKTALKSLILIKNKEPDDTKDKLVWKWISGQSVSQQQLSNPQVDANYAMCIYSSTLVGAIDIEPTDILWDEVGSKGYKYGDETLDQFGVKKALVKGSDNDKSKALVKGAGVDLPDPLDGGMLFFPVRVQLINHLTGICLETSFGSAPINTTSLFKAKSQ